MAANESNIPYSDILRSLTVEKFAEIFSASSRKARETYFHRLGVRVAGKTGGFAKPGAKNEARIAKLFEVISGGKEDDEMAEELLRTWLLTKRSMLGAALDHLGVEHDNGLTESEDLSRFENLSKREVASLRSALETHAAPDDIVVYLKFMGVKQV
jgi:hypothetical protein